MWIKAAVQNTTAVPRRLRDDVWREVAMRDDLAVSASERRYRSRRHGRC